MAAESDAAFSAVQALELVAGYEHYEPDAGLSSLRINRAPPLF